MERRDAPPNAAQGVGTEGAANETAARAAKESLRLRANKVEKWSTR